MVRQLVASCSRDPPPLIRRLLPGIDHCQWVIAVNGGHLVGLHGVGRIAGDNSDLPARDTQSGQVPAQSGQDSLIAAVMVAVITGNEDHLLLSF